MEGECIVVKGEERKERRLTVEVKDKGESEDWILIEIIKDMFQQRFVRTAKLKRAIKMRRFFASESDENVMPISSLTSRANSAKR